MVFIFQHKHIMQFCEIMKYLLIKIRLMSLNFISLVRKLYILALKLLSQESGDSYLDLVPRH